MVFVIFILCAVITVFAAMKLSTYADTLSAKTSLGGMLVGTIFLAGATSLPEVTTSLSAIAINNPDIAIGNVFGSNLFNLFILATVDLYYRNRRILKGASREHFYSASIGLLLAIVSFVALKIKLNITFLGIGVDTLVIIAIYIGGIVIISKMTKNNEVEAVVQSEPKQNDHSTSLKQAIIGFVFAAIIILVTGTFLSITGDKIAVITGLGSSFVGSFLIAATTSLPEAVSVLIAVRLRNNNLAIGAILGSNMFNMLIIGGADLMFQNGALLSNISPIHQITAAAVAVLSIIVLFPLTRKSEQSALQYSLPSLLLIIAYIVSSYLIFIS